jgi:hypothetical protein
VTRTDPAKYRKAAEQCRKKARSFVNSSEWVRFPQDWERLAQLAEALSVTESPVGQENDAREGLPDSPCGPIGNERTHRNGSPSRSPDKDDGDLACKTTPQVVSEPIYHRRCAVVGGRDRPAGERFGFEPPFSQPSVGVVALGGL